jgi:signal peptidase I
MPVNKTVNNKTVKDPWLAVNFSMFFPGIGHFYAGHWLRGLVWLGLEVFVLAIALWSIFAAEGKPLNGLIYLGLALILYCVCLIDTLLCVHRDYPGLIAEKIPRTHKNLWFAVFASRILPGLGHLYLGQSHLGVILLTLGLLSYLLIPLFPFLLVFVPLFAAIAIYHCFISFSQRRTVATRQWVVLIATLVFIVSLGVNLAPQWFNQNLQLFVIPSDSMKPTLQIGDRIFVSPVNPKSLKRKDIVVFTPNAALKAVNPQTSPYFIKRIVALPGETIRVSQGVVWIDNQPLKEDYLAAPPAYELTPQTVSAGSFFVLGDNRNNSLDSHVWGELEQSHILGRAYKIYWPPQHIQSLRPKLVKQ